MVPCLMRQCGHLAALGAYVLIAAEAGMFAFICQSTTPLMGLPGWKGRGIGNNPLAFATPLPDRPPLVFDMASSVVARGNLRAGGAREHSRSPRAGPSARTASRPPIAEIGLAGAVLPVGGYKGMGVAMLVQCLAGSLIGNSIVLGSGRRRAGDGRLPAGHQSASWPPATSTRPMSTSGSAATWQAAGADGRYPGRRAAESEVERLRDGIPVAPGSLEQMRQISERLGVPLTF